MDRTTPRSPLPLLLTTAAAWLLAGCQAVAPQAPPAVKTALVNDYRIPYVAQGRGETIILVHGAIADHRAWAPQGAALADRFHVVAYTQRYFGTGAWDAAWPAFNEQTHADDLAALIRQLGRGPVHVAGWSYSGQVALVLALQHPELVKSVFVFEPSEPTFVSRPEDSKRMGDDAAAGFSPVGEAMARGDTAEATRRLIDGVTARRGGFDAQPASVRSMQLDNARSMTAFWGHKGGTVLGCEQLGQIKPPVAIVIGGGTRTYFKVLGEVAKRCMPSARYLVVPDAGHMWPTEDPAAFSQALAGFVKQASARSGGLASGDDAHAANPARAAVDRGGSPTLATGASMQP